MDTSVILYQAVSKLAVAGIVAVAVWPFRLLKSKIEDFTRQLKSVQTELVIQRTNCLTTLQSQGDAQIKLLEKVSSTLTDIHLEQKETFGYLKGRI